MRHIVKGVHMRVSSRLKAYVDEHLIVPIERFCGDDAAATIEIHLVDTNGPKGGLDKECRVTVLLPRKKALHVTEATDDIYKSVALARDRLEQTAKKQIGKSRQDKGRRATKALRHLGRRTAPQPEATSGIP